MKKIVRLTSGGFYIDGALTPCQSELLPGVLRGALDSVDFELSFDRLEVVIDTLTMVVAPASCYDNALAESYLAAANMAAPGDRAVWVTCGEAIIVTACRDDVAAWLQERYGACVTFTSPLAGPLALPERFVISDREAIFALHLTEANAYIALWNKGLKFAGVLPYSSAVDIVYYVSLLTAEYGLRREKVYLTGEAALAEEYRPELARSIPLVKRS